MSQVKRFDHVGITVADLDLVMAFFVGLGLEVEGARSWRASSWTPSAASRTRARRSPCCGRPAEAARSSWRGSSDRITSPDRPMRWRTSWVCATSASRYDLHGRRRPGRRGIRTGRRHRPARERPAHGLRARTRGDRRRVGRADRLTIRTCRVGLPALSERTRPAGSGRRRCGCPSCRGRRRGSRRRSVPGRWRR